MMPVGRGCATRAVTTTKVSVQTQCGRQKYRKPGSISKSLSAAIPVGPDHSAAAPDSRTKPHPDEGGWGGGGGGGGGGGVGGGGGGFRIGRRMVEICRCGTYSHSTPQSSRLLPNVNRRDGHGRCQMMSNDFRDAGMLDRVVCRWIPVAFHVPGVR